MALVKRGQAPEIRQTEFKTPLYNHKLCDLGQITEPLRTSKQEQWSLLCMLAFSSINVSALHA